jgi:hypothetical protein
MVREVRGVRGVREVRGVRGVREVRGVRGVQRMYVGPNFSSAILR